MVLLLIEESGPNQPDRLPLCLILLISFLMYTCLSLNGLISISYLNELNAPISVAIPLPVTHCFILTIRFRVDNIHGQNQTINLDTLSFYIDSNPLHPCGKAYDAQVSSLVMSMSSGQGRSTREMQQSQGGITCKQ